MADLKLLCWNMEWMNDLFEAGNGAATFRSDSTAPQHSTNTTVKKRRDDLAGVLTEISPDIVVLSEGPNTTDELQLFFDTDVAGTWKTHIQATTRSSQCNGVAVRTDTGKFQDPPFTSFDTEAMAEFGEFHLDTDGDDLDEVHKFERRPLYVDVKPIGGEPFQILGLHLKSKGIFSTYEWSKWWQVADANRKKLLAQATQLRLGFIDPLLTHEDTKKTRLIVCGDINDGPGLDASEKRIFGSTIERLMGTVWKPELMLGNASFDALDDDDKAALNFSSISTTSFSDPIFRYTWHYVWIDHVLYSRNTDSPWVKDAKIHKDMAAGKIWSVYPDASDHQPVEVTVTI